LKAAEIAVAAAVVKVEISHKEPEKVAEIIEEKSEPEIEKVTILEEMKQINRETEEYL
jgi:hypothetical protein